MTQTKSKLPQINVFGTIDQKKINLLEPPYVLRNDCCIGQWKVGEKGILGDSLAISIFRSAELLRETRQRKALRLGSVVVCSRTQRD